MNQTKKRLSIINLAISITDIETIQLQTLQLGPLRTDEKIQEILTALKSENYAQAQGLITTYIETPTKEILQRTFQKEKLKRTIQDNNTIDDFDLFTQPEEDEETKTMDFDDMMALCDDIINEKPEKEKKNINFDSLLNIDKDDILPDNIELDIDHLQSNTFWDEPKELKIETKDIPRDTFFDSEKNVEKITKEKKKKVLEEHHNEKEYQQEVDHKIEKDETFKEERKEELKSLKPPKKENIDNSKNTKYKAIPYIDQKFKNMHVQYPPVQETLENFSSVNDWLIKISTEGYTEEEVEAMIKQIDSLAIEHKEEAAQLLLITAATESKYAQFRLARTLYKGNILQKNPAESFTLINRLATNDDYPEAICDLAQFYEHGIGIDKDKKKAEILYEEAMNLGIKRAIAHYERIKKQNKGLFSFFKK
jgi:hypothetical protein